MPTPEEKKILQREKKLELDQQKLLLQQRKLDAQLARFDNKGGQQGLPFDWGRYVGEEGFVGPAGGSLGYESQAPSSLEQFTYDYPQAINETYEYEVPENMQTDAGQSLTAFYDAKSRLEDLVNSAFRAGVDVRRPNMNDPKAFQLHQMYTRQLGELQMLGEKLKQGYTAQEKAAGSKDLSLERHMDPNDPMAQPGFAEFGDVFEVNEWKGNMDRLSKMGGKILSDRADVATATAQLDTLKQPYEAEIKRLRDNGQFDEAQNKEDQLNSIMGPMYSSLADKKLKDKAKDRALQRKALKLKYGDKHKLFNDVAQMISNGVNLGDIEPFLLPEDAYVSNGKIIMPTGEFKDDTKKKEIDLTTANGQRWAVQNIAKQGGIYKDLKSHEISEYLSALDPPKEIIQIDWDVKDQWMNNLPEEYDQKFKALNDNLTGVSFNHDGQSKTIEKFELDEGFSDYKDVAIIHFTDGTTKKIKDPHKGDEWIDFIFQNIDQKKTSRNKDLVKENEIFKVGEGVRVYGGGEGHRVDDGSYGSVSISETGGDGNSVSETVEVKTPGNKKRIKGFGG